MMVGNGARGGSIIGVAETAGYKHANGRVINDTSTRRQGARARKARMILQMKAISNSSTSFKSLYITKRLRVEY